MLIEVLRRFKVLRDFESVQFGEFGAHGFVEDEAIGEDVAESASRAVEDFPPLTRIVTCKQPALFPGNPLLKVLVECLVRVRLRPEIIASEFDRPENVVLERADEPFVE